MRLISFEVTNFGSYKELQMDLADGGLGLVYGKTGCGKSTIADIAFWILFGVTAKDGNVDDIRSWQTPDEGTAGDLKVDLSGKEIVVHRWRGNNKSDLFWVEDGNVNRGKDTTETQKMLNERLGIDSELYALGAYFHEFSPTSGFFVAKAKDRRAIFERIASLDLPVRLAEKTADKRKATKAKLQDLQRQLATSNGRVETYQRSIQSAIQSGKTWDANHSALVLSLEAKAKNFADNKTAKLAEIRKQQAEWINEHNDVLDGLVVKIEALESEHVALDGLIKDLSGGPSVKCPTCKQVTGDGRKVMDRVKDTQYQMRNNRATLEAATQALADESENTNPYDKDVAREQAAENHFLEQAEREKKNVNPFLHQQAEMEKEWFKERQVVTALNSSIFDIERKISSLTQLYDLSFELRGSMLKQSVQDIENETNRVLERYFDAEIRLGFTLDGADSLEVAIQKSGYECVYKQLSKGQRGLLKLAFGVAIMKAASNRAGVHFDNIFMDEALDGLDTSLKIKAFDLLQELAQNHGSVCIIEHSEEFKECFDKRYHVIMEGDFSRVEVING